MKSLNQYIEEKLVLTNKSKIRGKRTYNYCPKDLDELRDIMYKLIDERGNKANLNDIDVSNIITLERLFLEFDDFNGDISEWDVSNVLIMTDTFAASEFDGDISQWDVSNVTTMQRMFHNSEFDGDISNWDVHNVENMTDMFNGSKFTGDLNKWDVSKVKLMSGMFGESIFEGDISNWNVKNVERMDFMFEGNMVWDGDISKWNVSNVTTMIRMFHNAGFTGKNGSLKNWNVEKVRDTQLMFADSEFNGDLSGWKLKTATNIRSMFLRSSFNNDSIKDWNKYLNSVRNMNFMFAETKFSQDLSHWTIDKRCDTSGMFDDCPIKEEYKPKFKK
jgi:hypothetical protein